MHCDSTITRICSSTGLGGQMNALFELNCQAGQLVSMEFCSGPKAAGRVDQVAIEAVGVLNLCGCDEQLDLLVSF